MSFWTMCATPVALTLTLRDEGTGFVAVPVGARAGHFGLTGMREHARLLGGELALDLRLPGIDGVETTRLLRESAPNVAILLLTSFDDDPGILEALRVGARGCLLKDTPPAELLAGIHAVARGEPALAPRIAARLLVG